MEFCGCECHDEGKIIIHDKACCERCPHCEGNVTFGYYKDHVEKTRERYKKINDGVARDCFVEYLIKRLSYYSDDWTDDEIREAANDV